MNINFSVDFFYLNSSGILQITNVRQILFQFIIQNSKCY